MTKQASARGRKDTQAPIPRNLTVDEAGQVLGVGQRTIYKLMGLGELVGIKVLGRRLITEESIRAYQDKVRS